MRPRMSISSGEVTPAAELLDGPVGESGSCSGDVGGLMRPLSTRDAQSVVGTSGAV
jgi:hypothetical protein